MLKIKLFAESINFFKAGLKDRRGQAMTEYGLIIALIAVVLIGVILSLSGQLERVFQSIVNAISDVFGTGGGEG